MFDTSKIRPKSLLGPVKTKKFSRCLWYAHALQFQRIRSEFPEWWCHYHPWHTLHLGELSLIHEAHYTWWSLPIHEAHYIWGLSLIHEAHYTWWSLSIHEAHYIWGLSLIHEAYCIWGLSLIHETHCIWVLSLIHEAHYIWRLSSIHETHYTWRLSLIHEAHYICVLPLIITWLRCFFLGFDRFIPGFDRFIPGFNRFIPASIPVTGTLPPLQSKTYLATKMYFYNLISSFFISLIWNNTIKKYSAMPRMHIFLKNTVNTNPKLFRAQFNATGCRLWITACDRSLQNVVNVTQKTLF